MTRRVPPEFTELLAAALLWHLPDYRQGRICVSRAQAEARLRAAIDLPRGMLASWPAEAVDLVIRAQLTLDGKPGGLTDEAIKAACDALWPVATLAATGRRYAWQARADIGDGAEAAA